MNFEALLESLRDAGIVLGFPVLIGIGVWFYRKQIDILKEQIAVLNLLRADHLLAMLRAQKEQFEAEREEIGRQMNALRSTGHPKDDQLADLQTRVQVISDAVMLLEERRRRVFEQVTTGDQSLNPSEVQSWNRKAKFVFFANTLVPEARRLAQRDESYLSLYGDDYPRDISDRALQLAGDHARRLGLARDWEEWLVERVQ